MDKKMSKKVPPKADAKGSKPMSPKAAKLAAMSGDKGKITRGDVIKAAIMNKAKKK